MSLASAPYRRLNPPKYYGGKQTTPTNLAEWKEYAAGQQSPLEWVSLGLGLSQSRPKEAWGGGYLTKAEMSAVQGLQKERLRGEYQTAYSEAKAANLKRYQEILGGYKTRYSTAMKGLETSRAEIMGGLEGLGKEELAGIGRRYTRERASTAQGLISSGLHSTTVAPAVQAGVTRREGYAVGEARERHRRERLGYLSQLSDKELMMQTGLKREELDFMERREDEYPSESLYVQLMKGLGSS